MQRTRALGAACLAIAAFYAIRAQDAIEPRRVKALLIANAQYSALPPCSTSTGNFGAMLDALQALHFDTSEVADGDYAQMGAAIEEFVKKVGKDELAIFYYSGHAVQHDNEDYLLPVGFPADGGDLESQAWSLAAIEEKLRGASGRVLILDGVRRLDPLVNAFGDRGLAMPKLEPNTLISLPAQAGKYAMPPGDRNVDIFTAALSARLREPGLTGLQLFARVSTAVSQATNREQVPENGSNLSEFYLTGLPLPAAGEVRNNKADKQEYAFVPPGGLRARRHAMRGARIPSAQGDHLQRLLDGCQRGAGGHLPVLREQQQKVEENAQGNADQSRLAQCGPPHRGSELGGRQRILQVGRRTAAYRSGVGVRGASRIRRVALYVGRYAEPRQSKLLRQGYE
jgi:hypothetical protein